MPPIIRQDSAKKPFIATIAGYIRFRLTPFRDAPEAQAALAVAAAVALLVAAAGPVGKRRLFEFFDWRFGDILAVLLR